MNADLRYPLGKFEPPRTITEELRRGWVEDIAGTPSRLRAAVEGLSAAELETAYRPGGWTVRQVVHHLPDSHLNAYARFRLALTEDEPTIKTYFEDRWAELPDSRTAPIDVSIDLLDALHRRWTLMLKALSVSEWDRRFRHPELGPLTLSTTLALYAWHGRHHVAHITGLRERTGR
jgi:uncharacterized damage-inducible protein DinB